MILPWLYDSGILAKGTLVLWGAQACQRSCVFSWVGCNAAHLNCPRNTGVVQGVADYVCVNQHNPETMGMCVMPTVIQQVAANKMTRLLRELTCLLIVLMSLLHVPLGFLCQTSRGQDVWSIPSPVLPCPREGQQREGTSSEGAGEVAEAVWRFQGPEAGLGMITPAPVPLADRHGRRKGNFTPVCFPLDPRKRESRRWGLRRYNYR